METGRYAGYAPDLSSAHREVVAPYTFALAYRDVGDDRGPALHVFGPVSGKQEEILGFDCFEITPHYHLGWSYRDEAFIEIADPDPLSRAIDSLRRSFEEFVARAGGDAVVPEASRTDISQALERIRENAGQGGARP